MALRLRVSTVRRNDKVYRYHQLVRAVRKNGKPTHEVVAHLGRLAEHEATAIREALAALRRPGSDPADDLVRLGDIRAVAALRYLDIQVVHRVWQEWGLGEFFVGVFGETEEMVSSEDVVECLVVNRCVDPCSKHRVVEWLPRTALPEILALRPERVHNTRIHRALQRLEGVEPALTRFIVDHPIRQKQADSVIYLDLTKTWFTGRGGTLGAPAKLADGAYRARAVQIALAVDANGIPLRWELVRGDVSEGRLLSDWRKAIDKHEIFKNLPLVFDRGLASQGNLVELLAMGRRFITAARKPTIAQWGIGIDFQMIAATAPDPIPDRSTLERAGLHHMNDDLFYVDHGVRLPVRMEEVPAPGMRVILVFRPSLFAKNRATIAKQRGIIEESIGTINADLAAAKQSRKEHATRRRIDKVLAKYGYQHDYKVALDPIEIEGKSRTIRSFQARLVPTRKALEDRDFNAGWLTLLAHPSDTREAEEIIQQYHRREAVEHDFKIMKSFVELHPLRHQTDPKIRAHVTICVLALLINRHIELRLRQNGVSDSIDRVYEALEPCRLQVIKATKDHRATLRATEPTDHQVALLAALDMSDLLAPASAANLPTRRY